MTEAIAYHDALAEGWDARYRQGGFRRRAAFFQDAVLPRLEVRGRWLDVGCGSGYFSRVLAARGASVEGVDGSAAMIAAARAVSAGPGAPRFSVKPIEALDYPQERFDGVVSLSVLEYLPDPAACLRHLAMLTRAGGQLAISVPNRHSAVRRAQRLLRPLMMQRASGLKYLETSTHRWSRQELRALAEETGWTCEVMLSFDPMLPRAMFPILAPSLLFMVARRTSGRGGVPA